MSITQYNRRYIAGYLIAVFAAIAVFLIGAPEVLAAGAKGGSKISKAGDNASDLVSGIVTPLLIVAVGVMALAAIVARNAGLAVSAIGVGLLAGFFLIDPNAAQGAFEGVYKAVF